MWTVGAPDWPAQSFPALVREGPWQNALGWPGPIHHDNLMLAVERLPNPEKTIQVTITWFYAQEET